ncbi:MAG: proteasome accessory factor PafA2 family protein, partial [Candidatus Saccharimonadales bacterium]
SRSSCTHHPLVDLRDEALADNALYRRIHITCGDANMSPWATMMKLGSTAIVLRAVQAGYIKQNLALSNSGSNAYQYAGEVARDQTFRKTVGLASGQHLNALDFQPIYIEAGRKLAATDRLPREEMEILDQWQHAHDLLSTNPDKLADRIDWLGKKAVMEKLAGLNLEVDQEGNNNRIKPSSSNTQLCRKIDLHWDELGPAGLSPIMRGGPWQSWMPDEPTINRAITTAPTTTRAHIRGQIVNLLSRRNDVRLNWHHIIFDPKQHFGFSEIHLLDPRATTNRQVDELIARHLEPRLGAGF